MIGFVHVRDMFELEEDERAERARCANWSRPIQFVPETKPVNDLMRQMQQENTHMVIVVDEYGNTAGLATMEDLLEVIIGEIRDEHEPASDVDRGRARRLHRLRQLRPGPRGRSVRQLSPRGRHRIHHRGRPGERMAGPRAQGRAKSVERDGVRIEVLAGDELRVEQVRIGKSQTVAHERRHAVFTAPGSFRCRAAQRRQIHAAECAGGAESWPSWPTSRRPPAPPSRAC